jgi:hypothetical protein
MFLVFAVVQVNDPDPVFWILVYLAVVAMSLLLFFRKKIYNLSALLALVYLIAGILLFPNSTQAWLSAEQSGKSFGMEMPLIEEARESIGLLLSSAVFWIYFVYGHFIKK